MAIVLFLDKIFFIWASLFIMGLAFGDGSEVPDDPEFDCLYDLTYEGLQCYKKAYGFSNSHRGGPLGDALGQLVPSDYKNWPNKVQHKLVININSASLPVRPVNMTAMTFLAAHRVRARGISARKAVQLRNLVLLDYLDQVVFDIKITPGSCFKSEVGITDSCTI